MSRISKWERLVCLVLKAVPTARENDRFLYLCVLRLEGFEPESISLEEYLKFGTGLQHKNGRYGDSPLPNYDTITRVRRKLQERHPELRAPQRTQAIRSEAEGEFREYARTT